MEYKREIKIQKYTQIITSGQKQIIRPTEFKPKLNRFLEKYYRQDIENINEEYKKINFKTMYKVFIKEDVYDRNCLILELFSFEKRLLDFIESKIGEFLLISNFGKRQKRGNGSFYFCEDLLKKETIEKIINNLRSKGINIWLREANNTNNMAEYCSRTIKDMKLYICTYFKNKNGGSPINKVLLGSFPIVDKNIKIDLKGEIKRVPSPILLKPLKIDNKWYIIIVNEDNSILPKILGRCFEDKKQNKYYLPDKFNIRHFIDSYLNHRII